MEKITKDNKAITLVALVLTIVILLILASVITYSGADAIKNAKVTEFISKMQLMQQKVDSFVEGKTEEETNNLNIGNQELTSAQEQILQTAKNNNEITGEIADFIYLNKQELVDKFDIEDIDDEYIINFKTREVVSVNGVEYEDNIYYTQYLLPNGQAIKQYDSTRINRDLTFDRNDLSLPMSSFEKLFRNTITITGLSKSPPINSILLFISKILVLSASFFTTTFEFGLIVSEIFS